MSSSVSCKQCGCSEIDTDPARGDAVCTSCGFVLEESIIVSEVTFEEDGHGGAAAIGQFVSADSRGGGGLSGAPGSGFHNAVSKESREVTLRNAKKRITEVAQQLRLNQHCIDVSFNFFKMALHKQLTKGRKHSLTIAACIYMTCRIEGTPHLLIDFSDVLQMDVYALGRAYVQISRSLYINIPAVDPCMYILRFAHKFDLGEKTHDVAMTALRLVQRMKRDWIHLGRRPSGLCGAALLMSARLHNFSRTVQDIIRVVKVHETTLRKRLVEFGETPSSSLTLDEFMSVDLEEEHDPPSFKAARIKDRERLQKLLDSDVGEEFKILQKSIDEELDKRRKKLMNKSKPDTPTFLGVSESSEALSENTDESKFIFESTLQTINNIISEDNSPGPNQRVLVKENVKAKMDSLLMPPPNSTEKEFKEDAKTDSQDDKMKHKISKSSDLESEGGELDLDGIDDTEIDEYIMSCKEVQIKTDLWMKLNSDYLQHQKLKQEQIEKDIKEGKIDRKKKKARKSKPTFQAKSANEAIKIMLTERKMSSKINYDVLKSLSSIETDELPTSSNPALNGPGPKAVTVIESGPIIPPGRRSKLSTPHRPVPTSPKKSKKQRRHSVQSSHDNDTIDTNEATVNPVVENTSDTTLSVETEPLAAVSEETDVIVEENSAKYLEEDDDYQEEDEDDDDPKDESKMSARHLLTQFRGEEEPEFEDYYD